MTRIGTYNEFGGIMNAFIFHGTEGHPEENWFLWMKEELEKLGCKTIVPQFPTPPVISAKVSEWFDVFKKYEKDIDENTILIGHNLGGIFTLRVLEKLDHPVKAAVLVGTPIGVRPILNYDRDSSFSGFDFDWEKIRKNAEKFIVYHSDNDPYVGLENGKKLAENLGVELTFVSGAGHFNKKAGYLKFEDLRAKISEVVK